MSFVKYRVKEVATDFGKTPKEIAEIISKYYEKPKSNTQVLSEAELNALFDDITRSNQIKSLEQVFATKPAPKAEPAKAEPAKPAFDFDGDDVASEISKNLENLVGTTVDTAPKAAPRHPVNDTTTSKFSTMNLQFGRNYDVNHK